MANYIIDASLQEKNFFDRLIKLEEIKNTENKKMIIEEQEQLIKNIRLKLDAIEKHI